MIRFFGFLSMLLIGSVDAQVLIPNLFNLPDASLSAVSQLKTGKLDIAMIDQSTGLRGIFDRNTSTYKISLARDDMNINVNGAQLVAGMGLSSVVSFHMIDNQNVAVKGVLALTENQVNAVLAAALNNHFTITELHNHLLWESPKIMFLHFEGRGPQHILSANVGKVLNKIRSTSHGKGDFPLGYIDASVTDFNTQHISSILGAKGQLNNGVFHVVLSGNNLNDTLHPEAQAVFAGSNNAAVVDGNFVLSKEDLQKVLAALQKANIAIVEIHEHTGDVLADNKLYLHYWGIGNVSKLAHGVKNAFNAARSTSRTVEPTATPINAVTGFLNQPLKLNLLKDSAVNS